MKIPEWIATTTFEAPASRRWTRSRLNGDQTSLTHTIPCPCAFAQAPSEGDCEGILAWQVNEGRYGDVSLDGLNAPRENRGVNPRSTRLEAALGSAPSLWARAPGRVNLMGGGLDYNECFVLPAAIDLYCLVAARARDDGRVRVLSLDVPPPEDVVEVAADGSDEPATVEPAWGRYVAGVVRMLAALGRPSVGLEAVLESTVPQGAGLSSSAALEVACALALCEAAGFEPPPRELARACQEAEHLASGVPCGIMDQLVSLLAERGAALLVDCRSLEVEAVPLPDGVAVAAVHSGLARELRSSEWAERRASCEKAAHNLGLRSLRDATLSAADSDPIARHVVTENERVLETARALERGDLAALGDLLAASQASLRDDFRVSTRELDALVEALLEAGAIGARLTGGGFGGCVVALVEEARADAVLSEAATAYESEMGRSPTVYRFEAVGGRASSYRGKPSSGIGSQGAA